MLTPDKKTTSINFGREYVQGSISFNKDRARARHKYVDINVSASWTRPHDVDTDTIGMMSTRFLIKADMSVSSNRILENNYSTHSWNNKSWIKCIVSIS